MCALSHVYLMQSRIFIFFSVLISLLEFVKHQKKTGSQDSSQFCLIKDKTKSVREKLFDKIRAMPSLKGQHKAESRERDSNQILAISLSSTSIHSEHASISCCSREHFLLDFEPSHDVSDDVFHFFIKRREAKRSGNDEKTLYTPIQCRFLVAHVVVVSSWFSC